MKYKTIKKLRKLRDDIEMKLLSPIHFLYSKYEDWEYKHHKSKIYDYKTIKKLIQYTLDYHTDGIYAENIYVIDENHVSDISDEYNIFSAYSFISDMSYSHRKVREKLTNVFVNQRDQYIQAIRELSNIKLTEEEKKSVFGYHFKDGHIVSTELLRSIEDKDVYKFTIDK